jgi:hypothetical protein
MKKAVFPVLVAAALSACAQPSTTTSSREPTMLSEIYATRITNIATQRADVGGIVSKYLPVGTSRATTLEFLKSLGEGQIQESPREIVYTTRQGEGAKGNRRDIVLNIQFDPSDHIGAITSHIDKSNNL